MEESEGEQMGSDGVGDGVNGIKWINTQCRWDNGPISEPPTETKLMARACHYHRPEICYEFDMQKPSIPL